MATASELKLLIKDEFKLEGNTILETALVTHWGRFSAADDLNLQYLYTRRAIARFIMSRSKAKVDVQLGYDMLKHSQVVSNLQKIIDQITDEINEDYPGKRAGTLTASSVSSFLHED